MRGRIFKKGYCFKFEFNALGGMLFYRWFNRLRLNRNICYISMSHHEFKPLRPVQNVWFNRSTERSRRSLQEPALRNYRFVILHFDFLSLRSLRLCGDMFMRNSSPPPKPPPSLRFRSGQARGRDTRGQ